MTTESVKFSSSEVGETGANITIYIMSGQKVNLKLTGTGAKMFIQSELLPYINATITATGGSIFEL